MKKFILVLLVVVNCCSNVFAQASGADHAKIQTAAGTLEIVRVAPPGNDGIVFRVTVKGKAFDSLYGDRYSYYEERSGTKDVVTRLVMADFNGGFSTPPAVSLYDFGSTRPSIKLIKDTLDLDDVQWCGGNIMLSVAGKWYRFDSGKLIRDKKYKPQVILK